jgi:hypothetical protein
MNNLELDFAFEIVAELSAPLDHGPGRHGHRRINPIIGGSVTGPRLNGRVLPGGADYEWVRTDGSSVLQAHYVLEATDGTPIYIHNKGLFIASPEILRRIDAGEAVEDDFYYFRCSPIFEAPEGKHGWLSDRIFVGKGMFKQSHVIVKVFQVL